MANLQQQTKSLNIVISIKDIPLYNIEPQLKKWCVGNCEQYAYILHDKDQVDGLLKTKHIHLVAYLNKRQRLKQAMTNISNDIGVSVQAISIEKASNIDACIQYLVHKGHADKYQYSVGDIKSNLEYDELIDIINDDIDLFDYDHVVEIATTSVDEKEYTRRTWKWQTRHWRLLEKMWLWYGNRKNY